MLKQQPRAAGHLLLHISTTTCASPSYTYNPRTTDSAPELPALCPTARRVAENRRGSVVEQQSTVQWGSSVVGGSLELVTSLPEPVPEDKELNPGEGEQQGR